MSSRTEITIDLVPIFQNILYATIIQWIINHSCLSNIKLRICKSLFPFPLHAFMAWCLGAVKTYVGVSKSSRTSSVDKEVHYLPHHLLRNSHLAQQSTGHSVPAIAGMRPQSHFV
jgi:hypothetical protein